MASRSERWRLAGWLGARPAAAVIKNVSSLAGVGGGGFRRVAISLARPTASLHQTGKTPNFAGNRGGGTRVEPAGETPALRPVKPALPASRPGAQRENRRRDPTRLHCVHENRRPGPTPLPHASKEMAASLAAAVEPSGIRAVEPVHAARKIWLRRLDDEMEVIRHENVGGDRPSEALGGLSQKGDKRLPVPIGAKDGPPFIAERGDVVESVFELES